MNQQEQQHQPLIRQQSFPQPLNHLFLPKQKTIHKNKLSLSLLKTMMMMMMMMMMMACACVPSERDKRETHELSVRQRTHRVFGTEGNKPGTARTQNPPEYQQSGEDPASQSTSYNNIVARTSPRFECVGFFVADSGLAHLGQLITRAGDVEKNPGPTLCGECRKKVTSNSVKCTWCEQWIHQGCSGLSRQEIQQLAKANRYAFECTKCSSALSNPNREFPEDKTRGEKPCENPAQEPKEANGTDTREPREQALWPHLDQESAERLGQKVCGKKTRTKGRKQGEEK